MVLHSKIEHFYNEKAASRLRYGAGGLGSKVPKRLSNWITQTEFYQGYFLGPRTPRTSIARQLAETAERLDDFSVEMTLNKIRLNDELGADFPPADFILIYFAVCDYFARFLVEHRITKPMLLWYSTDAFEPDAAFPSHTMSFGFPRLETDYSCLDVESFRADAVVGTRITITR